MSDAGDHEANDDAESPAEAAEPGDSEMVYCTNCGEEIFREAEICPECGVRQRDPGSSRDATSTSTTASSAGAQQKDPGIAAVLSFFFTGLGQLYNGQIGKGIALIVVQGINFILIFFLIGLLTFPITWIFGIYDAYKSAERINAGEITP